MKRLFQSLLLFLILAWNASGEAAPSGKEAPAEQQFWHKGPHLKLPLRHDRGYTRQQIMKKAKLKIRNPRIPHTAEFAGNGRLKKNGSLEYIKIPVELKEEAGVRRRALVRMGFPLPQGALFQPDQIRLIDSDNREQRLQVSITGFWPDQSVKWALLQFTAPLQANETVCYYVECGNRIQRNKFPDIKMKETRENIIIDTGKINAIIDKKKFNLIKELKFKGKSVGAFAAAGATLRDAVTEQDYSISGRPPRRIEISEAGPERVTVRVEGQYWNGDRNLMDYVARLSFFSGLDGFELEFTHINTELSHEFTDLLNLNLRFEPAGKIQAVKTHYDSDNTAGHIACKRIFQETDQFLSIDGGRRITGKFDGTAKLSCSDGNTWNIGIADAWKRYPKAFSWDSVFQLELLPAQPNRQFNRNLPYYLVYPFCEGAYRMKWGMAFTERMRFEIQPETDGRVHAELNLPVIAVLPPEWYAKTKVLPGMGVKGFEAIDKKIVKSFEMRLRQEAEQREYGFFNYGDSFGEKGENWTNNEYDMAHGLFMTFLRTGDRRLFRHALAAARHQANSDSVLAYPDPYYVGANLNHGAGHSGRYKVWSFPYGYYQSAANGHTWSYGMLNAWHLYGEAQVMDVVRLYGDHIALAMAPNFKFGKNPQAPRECSWAIRALIKIYETTQDPVYLNAVRELVKKSVDACKESPGKAWALINPRLVKARGEKIPCYTMFITSVGLKGLCEYCRLTGDETVKPVIRQVAQEILRAFEPADGCGFVYDLAYDGRKLNYAVTYMNTTIAPALAEASMILKDEKIFAVAERAMAAMFLHSPGFNGKFLGEYMTFLADYLQCLQEKYPGRNHDFSDPVLMKQVLHENPIWHWRAPNPGRFRIRLKKDNAELLLQRWIWPTSQKAEFDSYIRIYQNGTMQHEQKFDCGRDAFLFKYPLKGKSGDEFTVEISDYSNADWNVVPSQGLVHAGYCRERPVFLARNGISRFYFEVPAGKNVTITYYGTHAGGFGIWCFDENGKLIRKATEWTEKNSLKTTPRKILRHTIKGGRKSRICSFVVWAEYDARLRLQGTELISGTKEFFATP